MRRSSLLEGARGGRRATVWRRVLAILVFLVLGSIVLFAPTACYLTRGAWEEAKILSRRRDISSIVADPSTGPAIRAKLRVVEGARAFARDSLGLKTGESFTTYSRRDHDTLVLVLSGAYRDRLAPYTWWFPVVGRVPYKGYFDFAAARQAKSDLEAQGFDTYLRPSDAFSTLGFFNDPLLNTTLRADSMELANTVIHELTHNTYYAPGQVDFNESFASFVGARGAASFFRSRGDSGAARRVDERWADDKLLGMFWAGLTRSLDSAFAAHPADRAARLAARAEVYGRARRQLVDSIAPRLQTIPPAYATRVRLDNATVLAHRVYASDLDSFERLWERNQRQLGATIGQVIQIARGNRQHPLDAIRRAASGR
ncbi:MAG: aminopeptidase [Gemmatimonadaceae bacterium]